MIHGENELLDMAEFVTLYSVSVVNRPIPDSESFESLVAKCIILLDTKIKPRQYSHAKIMKN